MITIFLLFLLVRAKVNECRVKFFNTDWLYCTKFGAPANSKMRVEFDAKLLSKEQEFKGGMFQIALYTDERWEQIQSKEDWTCNQKREMAANL